MSYTATIGPLVIGTITVISNEYLAVVNAVEVAKCNPNNPTRYLNTFKGLDEAKAYITSFWRPDTQQFIVWSQNEPT